MVWQRRHRRSLVSSIRHWSLLPPVHMHANTGVPAACMIAADDASVSTSHCACFGVHFKRASSSCLHHACRLQHGAPWVCQVVSMGTPTSTTLQTQQRQALEQQHLQVGTWNTLLSAPLGCTSSKTMPCAPELHGMMWLQGMPCMQHTGWLPKLPA